VEDLPEGPALQLSDDFEVQREFLKRDACHRGEFKYLNICEIKEHRYYIAKNWLVPGKDAHNKTIRFVS